MHNYRRDQPRALADANLADLDRARLRRMLAHNIRSTTLDYRAPASVTVPLMIALCIGIGAAVTVLWLVSP